MNGPTGYHVLVERAWAAWEALRRCGFSSDDIYVVGGAIVGPDGVMGPDGVSVQLQTQGKTFTVTCGWLRGEIAPEEFERQWVEFCGLLNSGHFSTFPGDRVMHGVLMRALDSWGGAVALIHALLGKGIRVDWPDEGAGLDVAKNAAQAILH